MALKKKNSEEVKKEKAVKEKSSEDDLIELKNQLARALADYDNLRKRTEAEKDIWFKVAAGRVIEKFLQVYDMLLNAQSHLNDSGLAIVIGEFKKTIEEEGFEEIAIKNRETEFDSSLMEAIEVVGTEEENYNNKIAEVVQSGWKLKNNESVLRPAKVKVFKYNKNV